MLLLLLSGGVHRFIAIFFVVIALALVSFFVRAGEEGEHSEHTNPHAYTAVLVFQENRKINYFYYSNKHGFFPLFLYFVLSFVAFALLAL